MIGGPLLGVFILGIFVPFSNAKGAFVGLISGLAMTVWIFVGFNVYGIKYPKKPLYTYGCANRTTTTTTSILNYTQTTTIPIFFDEQPIPIQQVAQERSPIMQFHAISYTWYGFIATLVVCLVGIVVSLLTGNFL